MTFRDELIEAGARAVWGPWNAADARDWQTNIIATSLDAMLAYRTTDECPTCGGRGGWSEPEWQGEAEPCSECSGSGRVPRDTPRLAVVEALDSWAQPGGLPVFLLAPDLPEGTP